MKTSKPQRQRLQRFRLCSHARLACFLCYSVCSLKGLTPEDMLVYQCIQGAGNMGEGGGDWVGKCGGKGGACTHAKNACG